MLAQILELQKGIKELTEKFYADTGCIVGSVEVNNKFVTHPQGENVYLSTDYIVSVKGSRQEKYIPTGIL